MPLEVRTTLLVIQLLLRHPSLELRTVDTFPKQATSQAVFNTQGIQYCLVTFGMKAFKTSFHDRKDRCKIRMIVKETVYKYI